VVLGVLGQRVKKKKGKEKEKEKEKATVGMINNLRQLSRTDYHF
jgi:hypothetical protein